MADPTFPPGNPGESVELDGRTWVWKDDKWELAATKSTNPEFKAVRPIVADPNNETEVNYYFDIQTLPSINEP